MKTAKRLGASCALAALILAGTIVPGHAAEPPATLWNFLGIPQGVNKIRDAAVNRRGNLPGMERTPPLKAIAHPDNLKAENLALKTAAKIKQQEDEAPQKIKALKYLASVGCACYPDVKKAMLAGLGDCTEEVRLEAAKAISEAAGSPCKDCEATCCSADIMTKLRELAHQQDDKCCYKEPSARVREAAAEALKACRRKHPPGPERRGPERETPRETVPLAPIPETRDLPAPEGPPSSEEPMPGDVPPVAPPMDDGNSAMVNPISLTTLSRVGDPEPTDGPMVPCSRRCVPGCAHQGCGEYGMGEGTLPGEGAVEGDTGDAAADDLYTPPLTAMAGTTGAAPGPLSAAPYMIGDFFGGGVAQSTITRSFMFGGLSSAFDAGTGQTFTIRPGTGARVTVHTAPGNPVPIDDYNDASGRLGLPAFAAVPAGGTLAGGLNFDSDGVYTTAFDVNYRVNVPTPGGVIGRLKIAENTGPIPRDRILFSYSFFDDVPLTADGVGVHRFTPGFEKTFNGGLASFELKAPMAVTMDNTAIAEGGTDLSSGEFGNLGLTYKRLVIRRSRWAASMGLTLTVPTADDTRLILADGTPLVEIQNESLHFGPFFGVLWAPNDRFFAQGFMQWDVAANGNPVMINQAYVEDIHDTLFQYLDVGVGYWAYRGHGRHPRLTGLALTAELHWNKSLTDADVVSGNTPIGTIQVGDYASDVDLLNLTLGAHIELHETLITVGYAVPLDNGADRQFDGELRVMINRHFGPRSRLTRSPLY